MDLSFTSRLKSAWNAFLNNKDPTVTEYRNVGAAYSFRPDRPRLTPGNERSIITSVINRIALDISEVKIRHCRQDENERFIGTVNSGLNNCLSLEANIDQTAKAFIQDIVMSMLDEGVVAVVPVDTSADPRFSSSYDIRTMRVAKIIQWYPQFVRVRIYNDRTGDKVEKTFPKSMVAIIENPLYAVMNERNSTLQRLIRKLNLLDTIDEQSSSGKLDLIIQLPYLIKNQARKEQADKRRKELEEQLAGTKYGIAYTDGTEKIQQLNRPVENNLMSQIEYLTSMLYSQLGINQMVLDGTADPMSMLNYNSRTLAPILSAITDEFKRKFLSKTARTQGQTIKYFVDAFRFVTLNDLASSIDSLSRNGILTPNESRQLVGLIPSEDPDSDMLYNRNMPQPEGIGPGYGMEEEEYPEEELQNSALAHHGVDGQKWGIRNGPPYPLDRKDSFTEKYEKNLDKWGNGENVLYIIGKSGTGKSTLSVDLAKSNDADVIHLDGYFEKQNATPDMQSEGLNNYLKSKGFDPKLIIYQDYGNNDAKSQYFKNVDKFMDYIRDYANDNNIKVIVEGVELLDSTTYPDKDFFRDKPFILLETNSIVSFLRASKRDQLNFRGLVESGKKSMELYSFYKDKIDEFKSKTK